MSDFKDRLLEYQNHTGKLDALFTILVFNLTKDKLIENLFHQLKKVKNMSGNAYKKKLVNDRLFSLIEHLKENGKIQNMDHIIFVDEEINLLEIPKARLKILKEYNVDSYDFTYGNEFEVEKMLDILYNMDLYDVLRINKHHCDHLQLNKYKQKLIRSAKTSNSNELTNLLKEINKPTGLIYGSTNIIPSSFVLQGSWKYINKSLNKEEICDFFYKEKCIMIHKEVEEILKDMTNPAKEHLFLFGKLEDIQEAIESYQVKELYCHPKTWKEIKSKVDQECLNFQVTEVPSLLKGDMGDELLKKYNGVFGLKYY